MKTTQQLPVYVKFLRFMIWSVVKGNPNDCDDVKIKFMPNKLKTPQKLRDDFFWRFHNESYRRNRQSPKSKRKAARNNCERIIKKRRRILEKRCWKSIN
jgi:hypothetical protein